MEVIESGKKYEFGSQLRYDTMVMLMSSKDARVCHIDFKKDKEVRCTELLARAILDNPKARDSMGDVFIRRIGHIGKVGVGEDRVFKEIYYDTVKSNKLDAMEAKLKEMEAKLNTTNTKVEPEPKIAEPDVKVARSSEKRNKEDKPKDL